MIDKITIQCKQWCKVTLTLSAQGEGPFKKGGLLTGVDINTFKLGLLKNNIASLLSGQVGLSKECRRVNKVYIQSLNCIPELG